MNPLEMLMNYLVTPAYADAESISSKGVAYNESRGATRKQLNTPGKAGEIGKYQIRPQTFRDLQRLNPEYRNKDFFATASNDILAEQALVDYLNILEHHYAKRYGIEPTDENLLQMYNVGPVGFKNGKRNAEYVKSYKIGAGIK